MTPGEGNPPSARQVTVGAVNWHSALHFLQLFRGFRLAINPGKIVLALLAILLIYSAGRLFDAAWGPQVYTGEIDAFQREKPEMYRRMRVERLRAIEPGLQQMFMFSDDKDLGLTTEQVADLTKHPRAAYRALRGAYERQFQRELTTIHAERLEQEKHPDGVPEPDAKSPAEIEQDKRANAARRLFNNVEGAKQLIGTGVFASFLDYELTQFDALVDNTLTIVRVVPVRSVRTTDLDGEGQAISGALLSKNPDQLWRSNTILGCVANMTITAPEWLFTATGPMQWRPENWDHWSGWAKMVAYRCAYLLSLLVLALFSLLVLALTGATVSRMSALELSGVDRAPIVDAFAFALRRLWVFVKAPITPFLILIVVGLGLAAIGLVGAVPYLGEIILGVLFIVFLLIGFVLMLLLLGVLGGFNLLYPAVAVEGSDAFDAMSRAFAYVYARPWRLIFYTVVSLIYGVITYLFVSFAVYLVLLVTHTFAGWGTNLFGLVYGKNSGSLKLQTMWPAPQFFRLIAPTNWYAMNWSEYIGSLFLHFWVYLLVCGIGAYVISYYFSTHTIIYLLLRRSVDGQATTEVFVEDSDEPVEVIAEIDAAVPASPEAPPAS